MKPKRYVPADPTEDTDLVLDVGEFGFIATDSKDCKKKKKTSNESTNKPDPVHRKRNSGNDRRDQ